MSLLAEEYIKAQDGKEMVLIPAGTFLMGSEKGYSEEKPVHEVQVKAFYMDRYLVTNEEYKVFCDAVGVPYPPDPRWADMPNYFLDFPKYPVVNVSCQQAKAYGEWAGKRLPTEEEWEYAACGGMQQPLYPWGSDEPMYGRANYADRNSEYPWKDYRYSTGYKYTSPVGIYGPNGYGLYDMAGNVWEWTEDWFFRYSDTLRDTEAFKDGWGGSKVCRGGCYHSSLYDLRVSRRRQVMGGQGLISVGFRCVKDIGEKEALPVTDEEIPSSNEWLEKLDSVSVSLKDDMEFCLGMGMLTEKQAKHIKNLGFTSVEQYVTWETVENKGEGLWDFSVWDEQAAIMKRNGLKWVPFLIAGPAYSLPDWYREGRDFQGLRCLEHNIETKIQSIWDKKFYDYVERFISRFAQQYGKMGVIEALLLGITGDFGEAIFPDWHGNWTTQIPGLYHSHAGYWCSDKFAIKDFRIKMGIKYRDVEKLNEAWGSSYTTMDMVRFPELVVDIIEDFRVDEHTRAGRYPIKTVQDQRRWMDFVDWYRASMTEYAEFWMKITRKYFPNESIYLCTGGNAVSSHGSDFADQCKIAAKYNGGVRITNEASKYAANFFVTNWVSSAGNFYNAYFGFEPAGKVTEKGIVCRIYNATAAGAKELHYYGGNIFDEEGKADLLMKNLCHLYRSKPKKDIGVLYPDVSMMLGNTNHARVGEAFGVLRDYTDFRFVDDITIKDGILDEIKYLIICGGEIYRQETLHSIKEWIYNGGKLLGYNIDNIYTAETGACCGETFFCLKGGEKETGEGRTFFIPAQMGDPGYDELQKGIFDFITQFLSKQGYVTADGVLDHVYAAQVDDRILLLNAADRSVEKIIHLPDGAEQTIAMEPNSIVEIDI